MLLTSKVNCERITDFVAPFMAADGGVMRVIERGVPQERRHGQVPKVVCTKHITDL